MINRLVIGIILAAVILGSSLLVVASPQQGSFVHQMGIFGYCIAFVAIVTVAGKYFMIVFEKINDPAVSSMMVTAGSSFNSCSRTCLNC